MKFSNHCMIDTDTAIMILPDGKLGKCEHFLDENFIGSIYDDTVNTALISKFKKIAMPFPYCTECEILPSCMHVASCPSKDLHCSDIEKITKIKNLDAYLLNFYKYKKEKISET